jgi:glycosyltransferase involved in cell wall biosynthesis
MKVSIIIPVYNEEASVAEVVRKVAALPLEKEVIVVDDGSTDLTPEVLAELGGQPEVRVVSLQQNQGKGVAVRTGFEHASGDVILVQDADRELNPEEIPRLLAPFEEGRADVVYGCRFAEGWGHVHRLNSFANWFLSRFTNLLYGTNIRDMETGFKVFPRSLLSRMHLVSKKFDLEAELTAKFARMGLKIEEVPVTFQPRTAHDGKKIHWTDGFRALGALIRHRFSEL